MSIVLLEAMTHFHTNDYMMRKYIDVLSKYVEMCIYSISDVAGKVWVQFRAKAVIKRNLQAVEGASAFEEQQKVVVSRAFIPMVSILDCVI
jgi:hypothetical protein